MREGWVTHERMTYLGLDPRTEQGRRRAVEDAGLNPDKYQLEPLAPMQCAYLIVRRPPKPEPPEPEPEVDPWP